MNKPTETIIDTLISARYVIPVIPMDTGLENYSVAVHNGKIIDIFPTVELTKKGYQLK